MFDFRLATTDDDRNRAYALRHSVFRGELNYQMSEDPALQLEHDIYDQKSLIVLLEHKPSGLPAGCMRLVHAVEGGPAQLQRLPLEEHCAASLNHPTLHPGKLPRDHICEISRLAVPNHFRRKPATSDTIPRPTQDYAFSSEDVRTFPLIGVSLFLAATAVVGLTGHHHVFAMMQSRLPRLLAIYGLRFECVGELTVFHGKRRAFYIDQRQAVHDMQPSLAELYRHIEQTLGQQYRGNVLTLKEFAH